MIVLEWIYMFSIAFQISGALVLMIRFWGRTEKKVVNGCFGENNYVEVNEEEKIVLTRETLIKSASNIYLSRMAFIYIVAGYLLGVYGSLNDGSKISVLIAIIIVSILLMMIGMGVAKVVAMIKYREDKAVDSEDIDAAVFADISPQDIDNMFE